MESYSTSQDRRGCAVVTNLTQNLNGGTQHSVSFLHQSTCLHCVTSVTTVSLPSQLAASRQERPERLRRALSPLLGLTLTRANHMVHLTGTNNLLCDQEAEENQLAINTNKSVLCMYLHTYFTPREAGEAHFSPLCFLHFTTEVACDAFLCVVIL